MNCANKFKQVGLAMHNYHSAHRVFPFGLLQWDGRWTTACLPKGNTAVYQGWSWGAMLLPYLEESNLYASINFKGEYASTENRKPDGTRIALTTRAAGDVIPGGF